MLACCCLRRHPLANAGTRPNNAGVRTAHAEHSLAGSIGSRRSRRDPLECLQLRLGQGSKIIGPRARAAADEAPHFRAPTPGNLPRAVASPLSSGERALLLCMLVRARASTYAAARPPPQANVPAGPATHRPRLLLL
eukprot:365942-Chlamydomonas_euryale.AAC.82